MKRITRNLFLAVTGIFIGAAVIVHAAENPVKPKYTVEQIMKAVFKGEDSTHKKIAQSKALPADYEKLVEYLSALPLNDPPQGDPVVWKQKSTALLDAAVDLKQGKPDALSRYNKVVNCQACHRIYRPE